MKRVVLALVVFLLLVAAGVVAGWFRLARPHKDIRGSSTEEFVVTQEPAQEQRTAKVVANLPWPLYGYDPQRTHVASQFHLRPPFREIWSVRLGNTLEFPPVVGYDALFVTQVRGRFFKIAVKTGEFLYRVHFERCSAASPALGNRTVYIALMQRYPCNRYPRTQGGMIVALRAAGGKERWRFTRVGVVESSPLLIKKTLYFGSWDHHLYALAVGGKRPVVRWTFKADNELNTAPAYADGTIFIGSDGGTLYAVDARTGRLRWRSTSFSHFPHGREYFYATPTVAYGRVYIGNTDGTVYAFGAASGHLLWARHVGSYVYTGAAVWRKRVYVGTYDGQALALDAATGEVLWRYDAPASIHGAPAVVAGLVYFSTCANCGQNGSRYAKRGPRTTFALDARTGRLVWTFPDGQYSPIVADRERVYVVGRTRIYALVPRRSSHSGAAKSAARMRPSSGHAK